jgi:hypothetical protein
VSASVREHNFECYLILATNGQCRKSRIHSLLLLILPVQPLSLLWWWSFSADLTWNIEKGNVRNNDLIQITQFHWHEQSMSQFNPVVQLWVYKVLQTPQKKLYTYKTITYCGICSFFMKKSSLEHYNYIFQIVWAFLGETELQTFLSNYRLHRRWCHWLVPK